VRRLQHALRLTLFSELNQRMGIVAAAATGYRRRAFDQSQRIDCTTETPDPRPQAAPRAWWFIVEKICFTGHRDRFDRNGGYG
jgi:hypothetical protein